MTRSPPTRFVVLLLLGMFPALHPAAQEPADSPASTFAERIDVDVVEVEVYATDGSGRAITDLTADDFVLQVDGRAVAITGFYASGLPAPAAEAAEPAPEPSPASPAPEPAPPARVPDVSFVVYVENAYLEPGQRGRALAAVEDFLSARLRPGDRVMVVSHGLSLQVLQPFTEDLGHVRSALAGLAKASGRGVHARSERESILRDLEQASSGGASPSRFQGAAATLGGSEGPCDPQLRQSVMSRARGLYAEAQIALGALLTVVESIAGVEGRKMLLYLGAGPPVRPGEDVVEILNELCGSAASSLEILELDLAGEIHRIATEANTGGVTIHTLDAAGLRGYTGGDVMLQTRLISPRIEQLILANVHDTFFALADQTGGRAILNANDPRLDLERVAEDLSTFYSLAFEDPHGRDGRVHRVELRASRPGVRLRYRERYRSQPLGEELAESTLAALFHDEGEPLPGGRLVPGEPRVAEEGIMVPIEVDLPFDGITLLPAEDGALAGQLRLFVAIRDAHGRVTKVHEVPIPLRVSREQYPDGPPDRLRFPLTLALAPGEQTLAVTVWDELGGTVGVLRQALDLEKRRGRAYLRM